MQDEIVEEKTPIYSSSLLEESVSKHADITSDLSEDSLVDSGPLGLVVMSRINPFSDSMLNAAHRCSAPPPYKRTITSDLC